jgi:hypothetical protein
MNGWILGGLVAGLGLGATAAMADEGDVILGGWYVAPMLQYSRLDAGSAADSGAGGDIAGGFNVVRHFAIEANYSYGDFCIPSVGHQGLQQVSLDGVVKFLPKAMLDPYFIIGAGALHAKDPNIASLNSGMAEAGIGALTGLGDQTGWFRMKLRTEVKYRRDWIQGQPYDPKDPSDILFGVGVQFEFGPSVAPESDLPPTLPRI